MANSNDRQVAGTASDVAHRADGHEAIGGAGTDASAGIRDRFGYQPALDGIRAMAVLAVIAYHDAYSWAKGGFLGVDAFFVLSGFLITTLLILEWRRSQGIAFVAFWGRRLRRLLPALLLVIAFIAIYAWVAAPSLQLDRIRGDGIAGLFYVANWRFIATGTSYFDLFSSPSPFRHLWSLAIEEQFYLVWPLVVFACLKVARGRVRVLVGVCVVGTLVSVWLMRALWDAGDPSRAYFGTDSRAHTILVGCLLALLLLQWKPTSRQAQVAVQVLGVVGALIVAVAWHEVTDLERGYYGLGSLIYAVAVAAVIGAAVQPGPGLIRTPLAWSPLRWIGTISYGLYLWHWPINVWLSSSRVELGSTALNLLRLVATFAAAIASYYLVELPIRLRQRPRLTRPLTVAVAAATVAIVLVVSTVGGTQPPGYLIAIGQPAPCREPEPSARRTATVALRRDTEDPVPGRGSIKRMLLIGDSMACSLYPGLSAVGRAAGVKVDQGAVVGCGIVGDVTAPTRGERTMVGTTVCHDLVQRTQEQASARNNPDVVVWLSSWERLSIKVGDRVLRAGTPEADTVLLQRMDRMLDRLGARGARLALLTVAPFTTGTALGVDFKSTPARDAQVIHLNALLRRFAARHPNRVFVVDLAHRICPDGPPCEPSIDRRRPRPDGAHFSPQGASWVAQWTVGEIARAVGSETRLPMVP